LGRPLSSHIRLHLSLVYVDCRNASIFPSFSPFQFLDSIFVTAGSTSYSYLTPAVWSRSDPANSLAIWTGTANIKLTDTIYDRNTFETVVIRFASCLQLGVRSKKSVRTRSLLPLFNFLGWLRRLETVSHCRVHIASSLSDSWFGSLKILEFKSPRLNLMLRLGNLFVYTVCCEFSVGPWRLFVTPHGYPTVTAFNMATFERNWKSENKDPARPIAIGTKLLRGTWTRERSH
jgi:hypothetical protein